MDKSKLWRHLAEAFKKTPATGQPKGRTAFLNKYQSFQALLTQNNTVLELIAGIEEKMSAQSTGNGDYMERTIKAIAEGAQKVADHLSLISGDEYPELNKRIGEINAEIANFFAGGKNSGSFIAVSEGTTISPPPKVEGYRVLIDKGTIASRGIGFGKAYVVRSGKEVKDLPEGSVLVVKHTSATYAPVLGSVRAIITDIGGKTAHLATLAREFHIPMIVDTEVATQVIGDGREITVDAMNGIIYEGKVAELSGFSEKKTGSHTNLKSKAFEKIIDRVIPLNLVNPEGKNFKPEFCETLHDVVRFAHQKAMQEMFGLSEASPGDIQGVRLISRVPLPVNIIDLGNGIEGVTGEPRTEQVRSIPFRAFLQGLESAEWPEPRNVDVKGFLGMIAHTASVAEAELERTGEESFVFVSESYMNFSIRLGYHLSVIESYIGDSVNDNYIRFFFKGGGADRERRVRRTEMISRILKEMDFNVKMTGDVIDALITKYTQLYLENKLEVLGRLTAYTKQMDVIMRDDESVQRHAEEFMKNHIPPEPSGL
jgi:pyruvate,water dikinase